MTFNKVQALARVEKYCNPLVAEIEYASTKIFVMVLISVVNEAERKQISI
jgi:hypothetical protein